MLEVKCFATLQDHTPEGGKIDYRPGLTVRDVLKMLDIPEEEVKVVFVNGEYKDLDTSLQDGDRLGLFPAVGGG
ncbi:MAG: MoaD/ThiS family protein [Desulfonauticus sp.]|nr:MoaD/ThiS family protein [Desulfonauticus sp.]